MKKIIRLFVFLIISVILFGCGSVGSGVKSIDSITKTNTEGLVDTYTITFTDGTTTTFTVTNGKDGLQGIQGEPGKDGHTPVITIENGYWYIDGENTNVLAEGLKGEPGNGISSITKTNTEGLVDTYTITFTDGTTTTFTVTNGKDGLQGIQGEPGKDGHTPVITIENGYWYIDGENTNVLAEFKKCTHEFSEWEVINESSCYSIGIKKHLCTLCDYVEYEFDDALEHNYELDSEFNINCILNIEIYLCTNCDSQKVNYLEIDKHVYVDGICIYCGDEDDSLKFVLQDDGTYSLVHVGRYNEGELLIPSEYKGKSVSSIGENAFDNCNLITSVIIPNSINSIGENALGSCVSITNIVIPFVGNSLNGTTNTNFGYIFGSSVPKSLKSVIITGGSSIEERAFSNCNFTSIIIPDSVTSIGDNAFSNCSSLTNITIPESVTSIGSYAFGWCTSLIDITIPRKVSSIEEKMFYDCTSLTNVLIPEGVTSIGYEAFRGCESLKEIIIPSSVTNISERAFNGCKSLESITIPFIGNAVDLATNNHFGFIFGASSYSENLGSVPESLKKVIITGGTNIGNYAFYNCKYITDVEIKSQITEIGSGAFWNCKSLQSIVIPNSVVKFGASSFIYCESLESIIIPKSVTTIENSVFSNCTSLTIYCEAASQPSGWSSSWNSSNRPVEWGVEIS